MPIAPHTTFPLGLDAGGLGAIFAGLATLAALVALYAALGLRDPMRHRLGALIERREGLKEGSLAAQKKRAALVRHNRTTEGMRGFLSSLKVLQDSQLAVIHHKLAQAGIRKKELGVAVIFARLVLPIALGLGAAWWVYWSGIEPDWSWFKRFFIFATALILGYRALDIYLDNLVATRTKALRRGLPDALDLLVICTEAGLTIDTAFGRIARELEHAYPELSDEFSLTAIELSFLAERRQAFENLAYRIGLDSIKGVITTMIQTERYGTPLASALRILAADFRNERMMRAEELAARLPAIMTLPLVLFILPVLFVVIMGPAACSIVDSFAK